MEPAVLQPDQHGTVPMPDGAQVYYRIFGRNHKRALVLLHGNGEDYTAFSRQIGAFSRLFRVIAIDSRGHGSSKRGGTPVTIYKMAGDLAAVLDALGVERATVLGFSDGANAAIHFALRFPERLDKLVLVGANLDPWGVKLGAQAPVVFGYGLCRLCGVFSEQAYRKSEILGLMVHEPHFRPEDLERIAAPTLVFAGERDLIKRSHTNLIAASIPDARLVILPDASHFVFRDQPFLSGKTVMDFLCDKVDLNAILTEVTQI